MSDHKLQALADSAVLKILQYVVTAIAIPLIGWAMSTVLDKLGRIDDAINRATTINATVELRLRAAEHALSEEASARKTLTEKVLEHDFELKRLKEEQVKAR